MTLKLLDPVTKKLTTMRVHVCHDCGAREGQLHDFGCDMERCPFCGHQLISCDCVYGILGYTLDRAKPYSGLPKRMYEDGLTDEEAELWLDALTEKGRIPYVQWPNLCHRCGELWPTMFMVPDVEWETYIEPEHHRDMLCRKCYDEIRFLIDTNGGEVIERK